jgi:hypothetical protein
MRNNRFLENSQQLTLYMLIRNEVSYLSSSHEDMSDFLSWLFLFFCNSTTFYVLDISWILSMEISLLNNVASMVPIEQLKIYGDVFLIKVWRSVLQNFEACEFDLLFNVWVHRNLGILYFILSWRLWRFAKLVLEVSTSLFAGKGILIFLIQQFFALWKYSNIQVCHWDYLSDFLDEIISCMTSSVLDRIWTCEWSLWRWLSFLT